VGSGGVGTGSKRSADLAGRVVWIQSLISKAWVLAAAARVSSGLESVIST
jgi:hypothetical protein